MVSIGPFARKVYDAMSELGANSDQSVKSADQIMKKASLGKGQTNMGLQELMKKKIVNRISRSKRAGYYICQQI